MSRRTFVRAGATLGGVVLVGSLAGCGDSTGNGTDGGSGTDAAGDGGDRTTDSGDTGEAGGNTRTTTTTVSVDTDPTAPVAPGQYRMMAFDGPVTLEYETRLSRGEGTLIVDVREVSGTVATLDLGYAEEGFKQTATISGDFDQVYSGLYTNVPEQLVYSLFIGYSNRFHGRQLAVGEEWKTVTGLPGDNRITITGTESHAGIACYVAEITIDDDPFATLCLRPGFGIPVHSVLYDQDGQVRESATLVGYNRP